MTTITSRHLIIEKKNTLHLCGENPNNQTTPMRRNLATVGRKKKTLDSIVLILHTGYQLAKLTQIHVTSFPIAHSRGNSLGMFNFV